MGCSHQRRLTAPRQDPLNRGQRWGWNGRDESCRPDPEIWARKSRSEGGGPERQGWRAGYRCGGPCQATLSQPGTPSLSLSPLTALGLALGTSRAVLGGVSQLQGNHGAQELEAFLHQTVFFLLCSFLHSTLTDHTLRVGLWARPWGYREADHSPSPSTLSLCRMESHPSRAGRPAWGGGCWVSGHWGMTVLTSL